jgi:hypothetical protein
MALARCQTCGSPEGLKQKYPHSHPLAETVSIDILCGAPTCACPAFIWLTDEEQRQYLHGQRSFRISNRAVEIHVM